MSTRARALIVAGLALAVVVVAVAISQGGGDDTGEVESDAGAVHAALEGVEQKGFAVGDPGAPVQITEYGDLQCPFCADAAVETVPELLTSYVRGGDLRISFRPLAFIGEDSIEAAQMAAAAALQDRGFAFVELFYEQQGSENSGYVTEDFLRSIAEQIGGLDVDKALADRGSAKVQAMLDRSSTAARRDGVESTPTFLIAAKGERQEAIDAAPDDLEAFEAEIERRLGG